MARSAPLSVAPVLPLSSVIWARSPGFAVPLSVVVFVSLCLCLPLGWGDGCKYPCALQ